MPSKVLMVLARETRERAKSHLSITNWNGFVSWSLHFHQGRSSDNIDMYFNHTLEYHNSQD